jgi:hypothetical protein
MITIDDLITSQTADAIQQSFIDGLVALGLTSAPSWRKGSVARSVLRVFALLGAGYSTVQGSLARSAFRDLAVGGWKTLWARSNFNQERELATFAAGVVHLVNTGGGSFTQPAYSVTLTNSATKKTYQNTAPFTLAIGPGTTADVNFQAVEIGAASSAAPGAIDTCPLLNVTCTNVQALVGTDDQSDDELDALCIAKLSAWSPNGAPDAFRFVALADPTTIPALVRLGLTAQTSVPITRAQAYADGNGGVNLYLATAGGVPSGGDVAIIDARVQAVTRTLGYKITTAAATPVTVPVTYAATLRHAGMTVSDAELAFANALTSFFAGLSIGGDVIPPSSTGAVYSNEVEGVLFKAIDGTVKAVVSGGDVALAQNEVAVLGTITPTVVTL